MRSRRSFESVYRRYHQSLYRYCFSIVGNAEDAQDALQNAMLKAMRALPAERREIKLKPWLYRIAHNESIELLRKRRDEARIDPELVASAVEPAETAAQRERLRRLLGDLSELPDRQRAALVMRELGGLEFAQIGEAFGTSAAVARQTVYEARLGLRQLEAGREMSCETVMRQLSDADGRVTRRRDIRAHLRACPDCRGFRDAIDGRRHDLAALAPLPLAASAGILHALLGSTGAHAGASAGLTGSVGAGAGKAVATSAVVKGVATVAVVAAVGVTAADRSGLIDAGLPGGGTTTREASPAGAGGANASESALPANDSAGAGSVAGQQTSDSSNRSGEGGAGSAAGPNAASGGSNTPEGSGHGAATTLPAASQHVQGTAAEHKANSSPHAARSHRHKAAAPHSSQKGSTHSHSAAHSHGATAHSHHGSGSSHKGGKSTGASQPHQPSRSEQDPPQPAASEAQGDETQAATGQSTGAAGREGESSP